MVVDSNIIIYAARPEYAERLRPYIEGPPAFSSVSYVEVLGFHRLTAEDAEAFERFFAAAQVLPVTDAILDRAIGLRQVRPMSLGDALIAATALAHGRTLVTRNVVDYQWIPGLTLLNPIDE